MAESDSFSDILSWYFKSRLHADIMETKTDEGEKRMADNYLGESIGKLGFGYMRLPKNGDVFDLETVGRMVDEFLAAGMTYFDTAWVYAGSEEAMRETLVKRHPRASYTIATKLPVRMANTAEDLTNFFAASLTRLGTDYVDFYLLHGLDGALNEKAETLGAWELVKKLKAEGKIRHYGFSFHGKPEDLDAILAKHPDAEFVQLQLNYLDWDSENVQARRLYEIARSHNKPITVMEPVKGGMLASEASPVAPLLKEIHPDASVASWALRFAMNLDGLITVLSGMGSVSQMRDNLSTLKNLTPFDARELAAVFEAARVLQSSPRIPCTGCRYCVEGCPSKINIPLMMNLYSDYLVYNTTANVDHVYEMFTRGAGKAKDCVACRACEEHCPQKLEISDIVAKLSAVLD
jgi:predicted aldo/keto reductase-like oxidoreductase